MIRYTFFLSAQLLYNKNMFVCLSVHKSYLQFIRYYKYYNSICTLIFNKNDNIHEKFKISLLQTFVVQRVISESTISDLESLSNFKVKENKIFKSVHKQEIGLLWSSESFGVKYNIGFEIPIEFPIQRKKIFKPAQKQQN